MREKRTKTASPERPYFGRSSQDLEALAEQHWNTLAELMQIHGELIHRKTPRAHRLEQRVTQRLLELAPTAARTGPAAGPSAEEFETLRRQLAETAKRAVAAEQKVRALTAELERAHTRTQQTHSGGRLEALSRLVGLAPDCPEFILRAAQRAYRRAYHPDALAERPETERRAAEAQFKQFEQVFEELQRLRPQSAV
jgi:hypothetical protein